MKYRIVRQAQGGFEVEQSNDGLSWRYVPSTYDAFTYWGARWALWRHIRREAREAYKTPPNVVYECETPEIRRGVA